ncbi:MAG: DUF2892 domain-containing protein [Mariprofundaceae bacterium]|nr:DUF2892 domain-containing protein [Mariprofundaceae bacterium]
MKANVGNIDRVIRFLAGIALIAFGVLGSLASPWNVVAISAGVVFALTAVIRFCPLYGIFGINSCANK